MNKYLKLILFGLLIWFIPFIASFFVWDVEANAPAIPMMWFSALMMITWTIGLAIALYNTFKDAKKGAANLGLEAGFVWYIVPLVMDLIFLVGIFGMVLTDYYPLFVSYLGGLILPIAVGKIKES